MTSNPSPRTCAGSTSRSAASSSAPPPEAPSPTTPTATQGKTEDLGPSSSNSPVARPEGRATDLTVPYRGSILTGFTFQISSAYCRMVRSLENLPERAVLRIAIRVHCSGSIQALETSAWQAS